MYEPACTMLHKCILNVIPSGSVSGQDFLGCILSVISCYIQKATGLQFPADKCSEYLTLESAEHRHRLVSVSVPPAESLYPYHWAVRIKSADPATRCRTLTQHIGIRQTSAYEATIYLASTSTDHLGGRFVTPRPPLKKVSPLVELLLAHADIRCISGSHVLLSRSIRLTNQSIERFLNLLYDKARTLPLVLITCPDLIDPELVHSSLLGNAIVCHTEDPGIVMLLNDQLPEPMQTAMGSVRIFLPLDTHANSMVYHPVIPLSEIYRLNPYEVYCMLYRAYAENFRSPELRSFVSVETCTELRRQQNMKLLSAQLSAALDSLKACEAALQKSEAECELLKKEIAEKSAPSDESTEYALLLGEYSSELELLKSGMQHMLSQAYGSSLLLDIPDNAHSLVIDLIKSINFRQMRPKHKPARK